MIYLVGLGNVGEEYHFTRHNIGWLALDAFVSAQNLPEPMFSSRLQGMTTDGVVNGKEISVLYPHTFMNHSGSAVLKLVPKHPGASLIVLADDIDLPFGTIRISYGRGHGGHNGIRSVIDTLGTRDFLRIRIGIGPTGFLSSFMRPSGDRLSTYVLGEFTKKERILLPAVTEKVCAATNAIIDKGMDMAMNEFN